MKPLREPSSQPISNIGIYTASPVRKTVFIRVTRRGALRIEGLEHIPALIDGDSVTLVGAGLFSGSMPMGGRQGYKVLQADGPY